MDTQRLEKHYWKYTRSWSEEQLFVFRLFLRGYYLERCVDEDYGFRSGDESFFIRECINYFKEITNVERPISDKELKPTKPTWA